MIKIDKETLLDLLADVLYEANVDECETPKFLDMFEKNLMNICQEKKQVENFTFERYLSFCRIEKLTPSKYTNLKKFKSLLKTVDLIK